MINNEVFLLKDNDLFVFDQRDKRLFRVDGRERIEIDDYDYAGSIVTGNAAVLSAEQAAGFVPEGFRESGA